MEGDLKESLIDAKEKYISKQKSQLNFKLKPEGYLAEEESKDDEFNGLKEHHDLEEDLKNVLKRFSSAFTEALHQRIEQVKEPVDFSPNMVSVLEKSPEFNNLLKIMQQFNSALIQEKLMPPLEDCLDFPRKQVEDCLEFRENQARLKELESRLSSQKLELIIFLIICILGVALLVAAPIIGLYVATGGFLFAMGLACFVIGGAFFCCGLTNSWLDDCISDAKERLNDSQIKTEMYNKEGINASIALGQTIEQLESLKVKTENEAPSGTSPHIALSVFSYSGGSSSQTGQQQLDASTMYDSGDDELATLLVR